MNLKEIKTLEKNISGIYKITNLTTNKYYIGQSFCIKKRFLNHLKNLNQGCHENSYFQNDFNKSEPNLLFEILEIANDVNNLNELEQKYLNLLWDGKKQCYNISKIASSPMKGLFHTSATKQKMSDSHKGKIFSSETRKKMSLWQKDKPKNFDSVKKLFKSVLQFDLNGKLITRHVSIKSAANSLNLPFKKIKSTAWNISKCCINNKKKPCNSYTAFGFIWQFEF